MANVDQNDEPSMEDILASIRKIIADDDDGGADASSAAAEDMEEEGDGEIASTEDIDAMFSDAAADLTSEPETAEEESGDSGDVFELTPEMAVDNDVMFAEDDYPEEDEQTDDAFGADEMDMADEHSPDLAFVNNPPKADFSEKVAGAAASAFMNGQGGEALLSSQTRESVASAFGNLAHTVLSKDARTLEDLVKEMLRPMLKSWLDDNLPQMVERMVREEIERLSRGGMR